MKRRSVLAGGAALGAWPGWATASSADPTPAAGSSKVLRMAFRTAEVGFDPPRVGDESSIRVVAHIFESLLTYDPLARPAVLVPLTAAALPEVSDNYQRFVFTVQRGIYFADDPVFKGQPRELTAADYVYSFKRLYDPELRTEHLHLLESAKILGLSELRRRVVAERTPFPYDTPVEGLRALDRYRLEVRLAEPAPRFAHTLAGWVMGAVAREVVEAYTDDPMAHPVGTGPFRLAQWRRASRVVLERNPQFREQRFHTVASFGPNDDPALREAATRLAGARAPLVDRLEFSTVEENQPRWLAFLGGEHDVLSLPSDFANLALPGGEVAPFLTRRGVHAERALTASVAHTFINHDDELVGGYTPEKVALRRAIVLAYDSAEEIRLLRGGQAVPAASMIPPHCYGYDPALKSDMVDASPARARALLDLYGYVDRDGDGWRERPDGRPLTLRLAFTPDRLARQTSELWHKRLAAVGLRIRFEFGTFGELIRRALAGQLAMWGFAWSAGSPDGDFFLGLAYGPNADQSNDARFKLPAFDALYERQRVMPDGPERLAVMHQANKLMLAYVPYIAHNHRIETELMQAHVRGPLRHPFNRDWFRWADSLPSPA